MAKITAAKRDEIEKRAAEKFGTAAVEQAHQRQQQAVKDANQKYIDLKARQAAENASLTDQQKVERALRSAGSTVTGQATAPAAPTTGTTKPIESPISATPAVPKKSPFDTQLSAPASQQNIVPSAPAVDAAKPFESLAPTVPAAAPEQGDGTSKLYDGNAILDFQYNKFIPAINPLEWDVTQNAWNWVKDTGSYLVDKALGGGWRQAEDYINLTRRASDEVQRDSWKQMESGYLYNPVTGMYEKAPAEAWADAGIDLSQAPTQEELEEAHTLTAGRDYSAQIDQKHGVDPYSVLGLFGAAAENVGQQVVQSVPAWALGATGLPTKAITFATSFPSEYEAAYREAVENGASKTEAVMVGALSGTIGAGLETFLGDSLDGIRFGKSADDAASFAKRMAQKIASKEAGQIVAEWAIDMGLESVEEMLTTILQAPTRLIYDEAARTDKPIEDIWNSIDWAEVAWSGLVSALVSGGWGALRNSGRLKAALKQGDSSAVAQVLADSGIVPQDKAFDDNGRPTEAVKEIAAALTETQQFSDNIAQQPASEPVKPAVTPQPTEQETALQQAVKPAETEAVAEQPTVQEAVKPTQSEAEIAGEYLAEQAEQNLAARDDVRLDSASKKLENIGELAIPSMSDIRSRIDAGEIVPIDELLARPEIIEAVERAAIGQPTLELYPFGANAERDAMRSSIKDTLMSMGSAVKGADGKWKYTGNVEQGKHADIIIGPPAAGKSSVFADPLSQQHKARIIDSDEAKKLLPEFDGGYGANRVQEESALITEQYVFDEAVARGDNIIIPKVGKSPQSILSLAELLKANGYTVDLYLNSLPMEKAIMRGVGRFIKEGRYVPIEYMQGVGNRPVDTFNMLKERSDLFDYYEHRSNDVRYGEEPVLVEKGGTSLYGRNVAARGGNLEPRRGTDLDRGRAGENQRNSQTNGNQVNAPTNNVEAFSNEQDAQLEYWQQEAEAKKAAGEARQLEVQELAEAINPDAAVFREAPNGRVVGKVDGVDVYASDISDDNKFTGAKLLGNKLGVQVVVVKNLPNLADGAWDNGVIYIAEDATKPINAVLKHELTHRLRGAKIWNEFENYALQQFEAREGADKYNALRAELAERYGKAYAQKGKTFTEAMLREELAANYVERYLFRDEKAVNDLVRANRSAAQRIWQTLRDTVRSWRGKLTPEQQAIRKAERMFAKALAQTDAKAYSGNSNSQTDTKADTKYSFSDTDSQYMAAVPQADELAYNYPTDEEFNQWVEGSSNAKDIAENEEVKALLDEDGRLYLNDTRINPEYAQALSNEHSINLMADTLPRVLDRVAGKNKEVRTWLRSFIERPLNEGKAGYARDVKSHMDALADIVEKSGIKAGTPQSAAVQWYGEGHRTVGDKVVPFTMADLMREFPNDYKQIMEVEKWCRQVYDDYVDRINGSLTRIYPNAERTEQLKLDKLLAERAVLERERERLQGLFDYDQIAFGYMETARTGIEADLRELDAKIEKQQQKLISGDYLVGKRLKKRQDYFHHFKDISKQCLAGNLRNIFKGSATAIDPALVTVSEFTKPKTKWTGMLQRRSGERTDADAVMGMALYIPQAEYVVHIDPVIAHMRNVVSDLVQATKQTRNANGLIQYLTEYTNLLAGKTSRYDRLFMGEGKGRDILNALAAFNGRIKANKVVLNARSAMSQFLNLPHAMSLVKNNRAWGDAVKEYFSKNKNAAALLSQSDFLLERYLNTDPLQFAKATMGSKLGDFAGWVMEVGDRTVAEITWLAAYSEALRNGNAETAVEYADDITRRAVGGRGIGEIPPTLKSRVVDLIAPFQLEVNNSWQSVKGMIREKDFAALLRLIIASWAANELYSLLFGYEGLPDVLGPVIDGVKRAVTDKDATAGEIIGDTARNVAGNVVSAMPGASTFLPFLFGIGEDEGEALFGDASPTRYGQGITGLAEIKDLATDIAENGLEADLVSPALNVLLPYGGAQVARMYHGAQDLGWLPDNGILGTPFGGEVNEVPGSYTDSGRLRFALDDDLWTATQTLLFGPYSTRAGREYLEDRQPYSQSATQKMIEASRHGIDPETFLAAYEAQKRVEYEKGESLAKSKAQKNAIDEAADGLNDTLLEYLYELFNVSEKVW